MTKPQWWDEGCAVLVRDAALAEVMKTHAKGFLKSRGAPMETLMRAVVGQQISVKAAEAVWQRFVGLIEDTSSPARVLACADAELRACGLSGQKVAYVRGIARGFAEGVVHPGLWNGMDDEAVISELVKLPGIGRWTAEMFLMFHLLRPDVLPVGDLGLIKGFKLVYGSGWKTDGDLKTWQKRLTKAAEAWRPYRSLATWYLWRSLDPVEVEY